VQGDHPEHPPIAGDQETRHLTLDTSFATTMLEPCDSEHELGFQGVEGMPKGTGGAVQWLTHRSTTSPAANESGSP
jgi:hypothetical protein